MIKNKKPMMMISLTINDSQNSTVPAIIDTGANCSCINTEFHDQYFPRMKLQKLRMGNVNQASGGCIGAIGTIDITCKIRNRTFKHKFIVCTALKAQMILGLDFAQTYWIGIDWDSNMEPYLRSEGKFLTSAMPLQTLNLNCMLNNIQRSKEMRHNSLVEIVLTSPKSNKPKPMVRLLSSTQVRLPPKSLSVVPVKKKEHQNTSKIKDMDVMGYESFYTENPNRSVVPTTHTILNKNKASYLILLLINSGEEVVIQKSCTIALGVKSKWKIKRNAQNKGKGAPPFLRQQVNKLVTHPDHDVKGVLVRETQEKTAFVVRHNTYTKPKVILRDVNLSPDLQKEFENLKEEYKDIFSTGPSDISITDLSEMMIDTKEDAIPYAARPYKLALQHQDFLR